MQSRRPRSEPVFERKLSMFAMWERVASYQWRYQERQQLAHFLGFLWKKRKCNFFRTCSEGPIVVGILSAWTFVNPGCMFWTWRSTRFWVNTDTTWKNLAAVVEICPRVYITIMKITDTRTNARTKNANNVRGMAYTSVKKNSNTGRG